MKRLILTIMTIGGIAISLNDNAEAMCCTNVQALTEEESIARDEVLAAIRSNDIDTVVDLLRGGVEPDDELIDTALENFKKSDVQERDVNLTLGIIDFLLQDDYYADTVSLSYIIANNLTQVLPFLLQEIIKSGTESLLNEGLSYDHQHLPRILKGKFYRGDFTPLEMAIQENSIEMVEMLINSGGIITSDCFTAAVSKNSPGMAQFLLDQVPQESWNEIAFLEGSGGDFSMLLAAETGMDILMYMIELHRYIFPEIEMEDIVNYVGEDGKTMINCSAYGHLNDVTRFLLQNGAQLTIDVPDDNGMAPIDYAIQYGDMDLLRLLLDEYDEQ